MKAIIRIPTEQYAYIELEVEGSAEQIKEEHDAWIARVKPQEGIPDKDYDKFIERQLLGEDNHVEEYQAMSQNQKWAVQVIKRALKRIEAKQNKV